MFLLKIYRYCQILGFTLWVIFLSASLNVVQADNIPSISGYATVVKQAFIDADLNADQIWYELIKSGYIDSNGVIQAKFYDLENYSKLDLPAASDIRKEQIYVILQNAQHTSFYAMSSTTPFSVRLYASGLLDSKPTEYIVNFGDGQSATVMSEQCKPSPRFEGSCFPNFFFHMEHTYKVGGTYIGTLSSLGRIISRISVVAEDMSQFRASVTEGREPLSVMFTILKCNMGSNKIDFGDGEYETTGSTVELGSLRCTPISVTHIYKLPGTYLANWSMLYDNGSSIFYPVESSGNYTVDALVNALRKRGIDVPDSEYGELPYINNQVLTDRELYKKYADLILTDQDRKTIANINDLHKVDLLKFNRSLIDRGDPQITPKPKFYSTGTLEHITINVKSQF